MLLFPMEGNPLLIKPTLFGLFQHGFGLIAIGNDTFPFYSRAISLRPADRSRFFFLRE